MGGQLTDSESHFKSRNSLALKAFVDAQTKGTSTAEALSGIKDVIRFTTVIPPEKYSANVRKCILETQRSDEESGIKISWTKPEPYYGVNVTKRDKTTGEWWEMLFHTETSLMMKTRIHNLYLDEERFLPLDDPRKEVLRRASIEMASSQPFPPNIDLLTNIVALVGKETVVNTKTRYWKWVDNWQVGSRIWRIFKEDVNLNNHFWKMGRWEPSGNYFWRLHQDPEFVEIDETEANELIQIVGMTN